MIRIVLVALLMLGGCGWFNDDKGVFVNRSDDYIDVRENPGLTIPPGLDTARVQDPFPIPPITNRQRPEYYPNKPPRPDTIYGNDNRDEVRIQRLGERRWLVVPEAPETVWPKVKQFLAENGVGLDWESPTEGRLDTEWMAISDLSYRDVVRQLIRDGKTAADLSGGSDRLRLKVEPGLRERTTEIHVRYEDSEFAPPSAPRQTDLRDVASHLPDVEQQALNELGAYIAARVAEQTVSIIALDIGSGVKSDIAVDARGDPILRLRLDRERAWATLGQALARATIDVRESDEQTGEYRITLPEDLDVEADAPGFFGRLFSFGGGGDRDLKLKLQPADNGFAVSAVEDDDSPLDREFGQQVLVLIREYAS